MGAIVEKLKKAGTYTPDDIPSELLKEQWRCCHMMTEEFKIWKKEYLNSLKEANDEDSSANYINASKEALDEAEEFLAETENHYVQILCIWGEQSIDNLIEYDLKNR